MDRIEDFDILERMAATMDLPVDIVAALPRLELLGSRQLFLSGHRGILSYSCNEIDINCGKLLLRVMGDELDLLSMTDDEMRIGGKIKSISMEE